MTNYIYETHTMNDPRLPFIFHRSFVVTQRHSLPNWHENIELLYCTGGNGYIQCGLDSYPFAAGDIFTVNANMPHCVCSEDSVRYCCLIIDNSFCSDNGIPIDTLQFQNLIQDSELNGQFEWVKTAFANYRQKSICAVADIRHAVLGLLLMLCRKYVLTGSRRINTSANEHIKNALTYIRKNISVSISLDEVSDYVGVSKYHLSREFKAFTGKTIVQTINLLRCIEAKRLIEGGMSVSAAAVSCGFENMSYFSRTFKKLFQVLPSELLNSTPKEYVIPKDDLTYPCY